MRDRCRFRRGAPDGAGILYHIKTLEPIRRISERGHLFDAELSLARLRQPTGCVRRFYSSVMK